MTTKLDYRARLLLGLFLVTAVIATMGVTGYRSTVSLGRTAEWLEHSGQQLRTAQQVDYTTNAWLALIAAGLDGASVSEDELEQARAALTAALEAFGDATDAYESLDLAEFEVDEEHEEQTEQERVLALRRLLEETQAEVVRLRASSPTHIDPVRIQQLREQVRALTRDIAEDESAEVEHAQRIAGKTAVEAQRLAVSLPLVALAVCVLLFALLSRRLSAAITGLLEATRRMSEGNLEARVEETGQDEFTHLGQGFNRMAEAIGSNIARRKRAEEELKALNEELELRVAERTAELRAAQDELVRKERLSALGQLTATVSHELRNPLGTIRTSIFTVGERTHNKGLKVERAIARIERNITRCDAIIGDLLDFTRARELALEPVRIDDWLQEIVGEHARPEGIELRTELGAGVSLSIDRERLRGVLINIMDNACHAIKERGSEGSLTLSTRPVEGRVELEILDTGPGFTEAALARAFEPLFSTKSFGVGLGLPLVKKILEQHGGAVEISNREQGGACIRMWLPLGMDETRTESER